MAAVRSWLTGEDAVLQFSSPFWLVRSAVEENPRTPKPGSSLRASQTGLAGVLGRPPIQSTAVPKPLTTGVPRAIMKKMNPAIQPTMGIN